MNNGFTKLFSSIVTSSIWSENDKTRILWITMLALTDANGIVEAAVPGLSAMARLSIEDTENALKVLESPDAHSRSTAFEGRRVEKIEGGWAILNYRAYRDRERAEKRKEYMRKLMQSRRDAQAKANNVLTDANPSASVLCNSASEDKDVEFERLWVVYPSKTGREKAKAAWIKWSAKGDTLVQAIDGIERYKAYTEKRRANGFKDLHYQNGATFFNQRGWASEWTDEPAKPARQSMPEFDKNMMK